MPTYEEKLMGRLALIPVGSLVLCVIGLISIPSGVTSHLLSTVIGALIILCNNAYSYYFGSSKDGNSGVSNGNGGQDTNNNKE